MINTSNMEKEKSRNLNGVLTKFIRIAARAKYMICKCHSEA